MEMARTGRPKVSDPRSRQMLVRVTPDEKAQLEEAARADGKPTATWLRDVGLEKAKRRRKR